VDNPDILADFEGRFWAGMVSKCRKMLELGLEFWYDE
jgi:hypothetical protein